METKFNFKSQICTDINQSKRLLALGLKKETADMVWLDHAMTEEYEDWQARPMGEWDGWDKKDIPAWSLHRLMEMMPKKIQYEGPLCYREYQLLITDDSVYYASLEHNDWLFGYGQSLWDSMLISIGWLINEELFNKEYLV